MELLENERIDDLQIRSLSIIQRTDGFCFGCDAVLLSHFASVKKGDRVLDLCTGTGIIPLLLWAKKSPREIVGVEIISEIAAMAERSVKLNGIDNIKIINDDLKNCVSLFGREVFDIVTCNPPYEKKGGGIVNPDDVKAVARHEIMCTLDDVISVSASVLKFGGKLCMVHRANRMADVLCTMRKHSIEPKRIQMIAPSAEKEPNLFLVEGMKGSKPFLKFEKTLYMYDCDGNYTDEINNIYERGPMP